MSKNVADQDAWSWRAVHHAFHRQNRNLRFSRVFVVTAGLIHAFYPQNRNLSILRVFVVTAGSMLVDI
jgi:hypothetical protein